MSGALLKATEREVAELAPAKHTPSGATPTLASGNAIEFRYASIAEAFPEVDPGVRPFGQLVLVQIRQPKRKTRGGIILTADDRTTEHYATQVAKVVAIGDGCFRDRKTGETWFEGAWCRVGDFVRVPKYQGDRIPVPYTNDAGEKDEVVFVLFKDLALLGEYTGDPCAVKAFN
jgi:co-chaperonin GroES (HSP10)